MKKMLDPMPYTFSVKPRLHPERASNQSQANLQASNMASIQIRMPLMEVYLWLSCRAANARLLLSM